MNEVKVENFMKKNIHKIIKTVDYGVNFKKLFKLKGNKSLNKFKENF